MAAATAVARVVPRADVGPRFYFWMAAVMAAGAFVGFTPTFWAPMTRGAFTSPNVEHQVPVRRDTVFSRGRWRSS
jgi:hypothetical protein